MKYKELRNRRKERMKGKTGKLILVAFLYTLLTALISVVANWIPFVGPLALTVIAVPLAFGFCKEMCLILKGEQVGVLDWFKLGFENFKNAWCCTLWYGLKALGPIILYFVYAILMVVAAINENALAGLAGVLVLIGASIWLIIVALNYAMYQYELVYHPDQRARDVLENTKRKVQGYKGNYFGITFRWGLFVFVIIFLVTFIMGVLVGLLTMGIGASMSSTTDLSTLAGLGVYAVMQLVISIILYLLIGAVVVLTQPYLYADLNELYIEIDKESNGSQPEAVDNPIAQ